MTRHFSDWLAAYVDLFEPITETPAKLHFWTGVSAIAGALTRRVWIDEVTFKYYPNFCIIFVAPPGVVSKSTTLSHGMSILRELPQVNFAADTTTYPAFVRALAAAGKMFLEGDADDPLGASWCNQCAMTAAISELGTFLKIEDEDSVNGFTDLLDCRDVKIKDTKTNGTDLIEFPFVNIIGATTPSWVQDKLKAQIGGWGLSSRVIFVFAEKKTRFLWSPAEAIVNKPAFDRTRALLVSDLRHIGDLCGPFHLDPPAADRSRQWYDTTQQEIEAYNDSPEYDNWVGYFLARKPVHMRKLSMIYSACRRDSLVITQADVEDAIRRVGDIEQDIPLVFRILPTPTQAALNERALVDKLVREIAAATRLPKRTALARIVRFVDSPTAIKILDNAIARGMFAVDVEGGVAWLRVKETNDGETPP